MSNKVIGNVVGFVGTKYDTVTLQAMYNEVIEPSPEHWFDFNVENKAIMGLNNRYEAEYSSVTDLVIPYIINGITIEWIGENTKSASAIVLPVDIENVRLPNCVKHIGKNAFANNANLKTINIPSSCEKIYQHSFDSCTSLENVITPIKPNYEIVIEPYAFKGCTNLNNIDTIIDGIKTIARYCFSGCGTTNVTVSESTDVIESYSLAHNGNLNSVTILNPNCTIYPNILYFSTKCKVIKGYKNSTAETYAKENGLTFIALDEAGSQGTVDLSNYYNKQEIDNKLDNIDIPNVDLSDYYTKEEVNQKIDNIDIPENLESIVTTDYFCGIQDTLNTLDFNFIPGYINTSSGLITNNFIRLVTKDILCLPYDIVLKRNAANRMAVISYSDYNGNGCVDNGWISSDYTITSGTFFRISVARLAGQESTQILIPAEDTELYKTIEIYRAGFEGVNLRDTYATQRRIDCMGIIQDTIKPSTMIKKVNGINHRGYADAPENTLPAYKLSKKNGFDYVECDVCFTSDNIPVLLHDESINRTAKNLDGSDISGTINIADITYDEALNYDFGIKKSSEYAGTKIPTFDEFLQLCVRLSLHPYIELKVAMDDEHISILIDKVKQYGMLDAVTWISFTYDNLARIVKFYKKARVGVLWGTPSLSACESYLKYIKRLLTGYNEVFVDINVRNGLSDDIVNYFIEYNIPIEVYCPNTEDEILALNLYISGVTSDKLVASNVMSGEGGVV